MKLTTSLQASLLDSYEYAMHGRIFKIEHKDNQIIDVMASFGGLLFKLTGEQSQLDALRMDMK
jgi:DNA-directed RNA polymerase I, II, and III subunit RPABC3